MYRDKWDAKNKSDERLKRLRERNSNIPDFVERLYFAEQRRKDETHRPDDTV